MSRPIAPWRLDALLDGYAQVPAALAGLSVSGIASDSRQVRPGDLFLALPGVYGHGAPRIPMARANGALAVVVDPSGLDADAREALQGPELIIAEGLWANLGHIAERFYAHPSRALTLIGITGTNGKTSVSHYIAEALDLLGSPAAVVGTLGAGRPGALIDFGKTTPDAITLSRTLAELRDAGIACVVMEVSSHGLTQGRVQGMAFDQVVFTNLTQDHLDYHGDMAAYGAAKALLFRLPGVRRAVLNRDDPFSAELLALLPEGCEVLGFSLEQALDSALQGVLLSLAPSGLQLRLELDGEVAELRAALLGRFNAANLLAAAGVLHGMGYPLDAIANALAKVRAVPGRMQLVSSTAQTPQVVVDFAHTPDALEQVLGALRGHTDGMLHCVFGCGGDRDAQKRPLMGAIAERLADALWVTDDNPRSEPPSAIVRQILAGMLTPEVAHVIHDRALAIRTAIGASAVGDVVLLAGKGHEPYQEVAGERRPFHDLAEAHAALALYRREVTHD